MFFPLSYGKESEQGFLHNGERTVSAQGLLVASWPTCRGSLRRGRLSSRNWTKLSPARVTCSRAQGGRRRSRGKPNVTGPLGQLGQDEAAHRRLPGSARSASCWTPAGRARGCPRPAAEERRRRGHFRRKPLNDPRLKRILLIFTTGPQSSRGGVR